MSLSFFNNPGRTDLTSACLQYKQAKLLVWNFDSAIYILTYKVMVICSYKISKINTETLCISTRSLAPFDCEADAIALLQDLH